MKQWLNNGMEEKSINFLNILFDNGAANIHQCTLMLKACKNSNEQYELMTRMMEANVRPTIATYNTLIDQVGEFFFCWISQSIYFKRI